MQVDLNCFFPFAGFHLIAKTTHLEALRSHWESSARWVTNKHIIIYVYGMFPVAYGIYIIWVVNHLPAWMQPLTSHGLTSKIDLFHHWLHVFSAHWFFCLASESVMSQVIAPCGPVFCHSSWAGLWHEKWHTILVALWTGNSWTNEILMITVMIMDYIPEPMIMDYNLQKPVNYKNRWKSLLRLFLGRSSKCRWKARLCCGNQHRRWADGGDDDDEHDIS